MGCDGVSDVFREALFTGVEPAHLALEFGKLTDDQCEEVGLGNVCGAASSTRKDDALSVVADENRSMIRTIFADSELARDILSKMH